MSKFENPAGRRLAVSLPHTEWPELQEAAATYAEVQQERKVVGQRLTSLQRTGRDAAQRQDEIALAEAIEQGKAEPKTSKVEEVEREIAVCQRRFGALEVVLDKAEQNLIEVVDAHRDEWVAVVDAEFDEAFAKYAQAIEEVATARAEISQKFSLRHWLRGFPEEPYYKVGGSSVVVALKAMHGDPYTFDQVIDALRTDAEGPAQIKDVPVVDSLGAETQRRHEEKQRNLEAGFGYYTNDELQRRQANPIAFDHGADAAPLRSMRLPTHVDD